MADAHCSELGIPERLHADGRPNIELDSPGEKLFRRFNKHTGDTVTACFRFGDTSVNREGIPPNTTSEPADALINHETGESYEDCGVLVFEVGSLKSAAPDGCWIVEKVPGRYQLSPRHDPLRCNYVHVEIEVLKDGQKQSEIKPTLIKLAIRQWLQSRMRIVLPLERAGTVLPVDRQITAD